MKKLNESMHDNIFFIISAFILCRLVHKKIWIGSGSGQLRFFCKFSFKKLNFVTLSLKMFKFVALASKKLIFCKFSFKKLNFVTLSLKMFKFVALASKKLNFVLFSSKKLNFSQK